MRTCRTSFSLDAVTDHALIEKLAQLQRNGEASAYIRKALYVALENTPTTVDVLEALKRVESLLNKVLAVVSTGRIVVEARPVEDQELVTEMTNLADSLSKFKRRSDE